MHIYVMAIANHCWTVLGALVNMAQIWGALNPMWLNPFYLYVTAEVVLCRNLNVDFHYSFNIV